MKFLALRLSASNLERQRDFYVETLGLNLLEQTPESFTVKAGFTALRFNFSDGDVKPYHFAFNIPENKLTEAKAWLLERVELLEENGQNQFFSSWNADQLYFLDMDGNILEFIARHELPNASRDPFSSAHIANVSEIGYVVPDVKKAVESLNDLGLTPYRKPEQTFAAIGDAQGLLIVAEMNRPWFPTEGLPNEVRAGIGMLELTLSSAQPFNYAEPGLPYHLRGVSEN